MTGVPTDISFSRLQAYQRCPWLYKLVYHDGWRSGPTAGMALGQSLHRALGRYLAPGNAERSLDRLMEIFDEEWVNEGFSSPAETIERYEAARVMLERFFESEKTLAGDVIGTEIDFDLPLTDSLRFRGTIDRLDKLPDGRYEVVEYKTNAEGWTPERAASDLQMTLYALGMRRALAVPAVKLRYQFLSNGASLLVKRAEDQLSAAEKLLSEIGFKIQSGAFNPNHAHCPRCEFAGRCVNYRPAGSPGDRS